MASHLGTGKNALSENHPGEKESTGEKTSEPHQRSGTWKKSGSWKQSNNDLPLQIKTNISSRHKDIAELNVEVFGLCYGHVHTVDNATVIVKSKKTPPKSKTTGTSQEVKHSLQ